MDFSEKNPFPKDPFFRTRTPIKQRVCVNNFIFRSCLCKLSSLLLWIQQEECKNSLDKLFAKTVISWVYWGGWFWGVAICPLKHTKINACKLAAFKSMFDHSNLGQPPNSLIFLRFFAKQVGDSSPLLVLTGRGRNASKNRVLAIIS